MAEVWKHFQDGGGMMYGILLWSAITLGIIIERALYLFGASINKDVFLATMQKCILAGDIAKAVKMCSAANAPLARIVQAVADITDSPAGLLLTRDEDGALVLAARWHWPTAEVPGVGLGAPAIRFLEQAVKAGHQDANGLYMLAMAYKHQGRGGEARAMLAKIADPDANVLLQRGVLAFNDKEWANAGSEFEKAYAAAA